MVLSSYAGTLTVTGTVVSDNQKMIGARYMGYVQEINFEIGDKVKREDTLFEMESAEFDILKNQADLMKVDEGDFVNLEIPSMKFKTKGRIKSIVPSANPMTHTFTIRVKFDKDRAKVFPGMYAKVGIEYEEEKE